MATIPTEAAANTTPTVIGHWVTIVKAHEKLLLALVAAFVLIHYADKAYDAYGNHLRAEQTKTNTQIATQEKANADIQAQLALLKATVDANAKIDDAKIAASKQKLVVTQKADAALPLPDLSKHWEDMLNLTPGSITPQSSGTVAVTTDAAHTTVARLEEAYSLEIQLSATTDKLNGCTQVRTQLDAQVAGLNSSLTLEKTGRAEDARVAKQEQHKSWMRGFKWGAITGFLGGVLALHKI